MPGGVSDSSQVVGGDDSELTMKMMIRRALSSGDANAGLVQRFEDFQRIERAAHAQVVRHAAVDEMQVGPPLAVAQRLLALERSYRPCRGSRRIVGVEERLHPGGRRRIAAAAVVVEREGREHDRHRRRGRGRARQRYGTEVRADDVERALVEDEARPGREVRRRHRDHRPLAADEIGEGRVVEQDFIVELSGELGTTPVRRRQRSPIEGTQRAGDDIALDVALQEALLVLVEQLLTVETVGQRGEAAAGDAGDDVDRVEQAHLPAPGLLDLGAAKEFEDAVRERGGARAAPRERKDDQVGLVLDLRLARLEAVARVRVGLGDRRVDRAVGATAEQQQRKQRQLEYV